MKRRILAVVLALGTVAGFASGIHSMRCHRERRAAFERHVASVCIDAARGEGRDEPRRGYRDNDR